MNSKVDLTPWEKWRKLWAGEPCPPFIIAELSGNHQGSYEQAKALIDAAHVCGCDAIKLQTYTADTMTLPVNFPDFRIEDTKSLWTGRTLYDLYTEASTPWEWHPSLFAYARSLGMLAFSSPFDRSAVDFLDSIDVPAYKIASFEITDIPLIQHAAGKKKPLILSTGMASLGEIEKAVNTARLAGAPNVALLKCTSRYPASIEHANLKTIPVMAQAFQCPVGYSDHTLGVASAVTSVALGGRIIEKHLVLSGATGAIDAGFSATPEVMAELVRQSHQAWSSLGDVVFGGSEDDLAEKRFRRSIYVSGPIRKGDLFSLDNLRVIRPGYGLAPVHLETVLGKQSRSDLEVGMPLKWDDVD